MTIEQLLELPPDALEQMTDEQLLKHFEQYLPITRPELAPRPKQQLSEAWISPERRNQAKMKYARLIAAGIDPGITEEQFIRKLCQSK